MKVILAAAALVLSFVQPALSACTIETQKILSNVPYFSTDMSVMKADGPMDGPVTYRHNDDARMVASFTMVQAPFVGSVSRSQHVASLDAIAKAKMNLATSQGRWAEKSVFPYDPVAWRVVESTEISGVGKSLVGHMEIRVTPSCLMVADFVAPASENLKSRWVSMVENIAKIRDYSVSDVVADTWLPEDTTPTGIKGLLAGFISPMIVIALFSLALTRSRQLDQPSVYTKIVLGVCSVFAFGSLAYQFPAYQMSLSEEVVKMKHVDSLLMLLFIGTACLAGILKGYNYAIAGFTSAGIGGFALVVSSYLGWTPDPLIGLVIGGSLMSLGVLAFTAWDHTSKGYRKLKAREQSTSA